MRSSQASESCSPRLAPHLARFFALPGVALLLLVLLATATQLQGQSLASHFGAPNSDRILDRIDDTNLTTITPLNLTSITLGGTGAASFAPLNNCGTTLALGTACTLLVQFAPTVKGAQSATVTITSNNPSTTATVTLSGTGQ
jgi:hypothetical protein